MTEDREKVWDVTFTVLEGACLIAVLVAVALFLVWSVWMMVCVVGIIFGVGDPRILVRMLCFASEFLLPFPLLMLYVGCVAYTYSAARRWWKRWREGRRAR